MHYLTLQDMIWLNLQLTKSTGEFEVEPLEEATLLGQVPDNGRHLRARVNQYEDTW